MPEGADMADENDLVRADEMGTADDEPEGVEEVEDGE